MLFRRAAAQVAKPGIAAVSKTAGRKAAQVQILPWALSPHRRRKTRVGPILAVVVLGLNIAVIFAQWRGITTRSCGSLVIFSHKGFGATCGCGFQHAGRPGSRALGRPEIWWVSGRDWNLGDCGGSRPPALFGPAGVVAFTWVVLGVGFVIAGIVLFLTAPKDEEEE